MIYKNDMAMKCISRIQNTALLKRIMDFKNCGSKLHQVSTYYTKSEYQLPIQLPAKCRRKQWKMARGLVSLYPGGSSWLLLLLGPVPTAVVIYRAN